MSLSARLLANAVEQQELAKSEMSGWVYVCACERVHFCRDVCMYIKFKPNIKRKNEYVIQQSLQLCARIIQCLSVGTALAIYATSSNFKYHRNHKISFARTQHVFCKYNNSNDDNSSCKVCECVCVYVMKAIIFGCSVG